MKNFLILAGALAVFISFNASAQAAEEKVTTFTTTTLTKTDTISEESRPKKKHGKRYSSFSADYRQPETSTISETTEVEETTAVTTKVVDDKGVVKEEITATEVKKN